jgi:hypothetical protein
MRVMSYKCGRLEFFNYAREHSASFEDQTINLIDNLQAYWINRDG